MERLVDQIAKFKWMLYQSLQQYGFTDEEALRIIENMAVPDEILKPESPKGRAASSSRKS